ncbi:MAG: hypothetical protein K8S14_07485 [Actinomycetia bacterium]|nr:hypothetical protein [Actinomycetes bacterium]
MTIRLLPLLIVLLSCNPVNDNNAKNKKTAVDSLSQQIIDDNDYISIRDKYIKYFHSIDLAKVDWNNRNDSIWLKEKEARLDLEIRLKNLIEVPKVIDSEDSKINLVTLFDDYGFGLMDGLIFNNDSLKIYCTTTNIFHNYFQNGQFNNLGNLNLEEIEQILNSVLYYDARISIFYMNKTIAETGNTTYGLLGGIGQDFVFAPFNIYTLSFIGEKIYIIEQRINTDIERIVECNSVMDSITSKSKGYIDSYYKSGEIDSIVISSPMKLEDFAYKKYCECFHENFPLSHQFENVDKQIMQIKNFIQRLNN